LFDNALEELEFPLIVTPYNSRMTLHTFSLPFSQKFSEGIFVKILGIESNIVYGTKDLSPGGSAFVSFEYFVNNNLVDTDSVFSHDLEFSLTKKLSVPNKTEFLDIRVDVVFYKRKALELRNLEVYYF
jgi:hypothetical protein